MNRKRCLALICVLTLVLVGCRNIEKNKEVKSSKEDIKVSEEAVSEELYETTSEETDSNKKEDNAGENESNASNKNQSNKNESTGNSNATTKPSNGSSNTGNSGSNNSDSTNNSGSTDNSGSAGITGNTQNNNTSTTTPSKPAHTHSWTEVKETVVVQEAWVEDVYGWRTICGKCGLDMTEMNGEDLVAHSALICKSRYSNKYIKIDEIQHPAVTEERVTGYKCECGATKK